MTNHVTKGDLCASIGMAPFADQLDIFNLPPASRTNDPITSKMAGNAFEARLRDGRLSELHQQVLSALKLNGPLTDECLERLPAFAKYAPSTIRKRRSELYAVGRVVEHGMMTNSRGKAMTIWAVA